MKVRAITVGISFGRDGISSAREQIAQAAEVADKVKHQLEQAGYEVQTVRLCTNPFESWLDCSSEAVVQDQIQALDTILEAFNFGFASIGPCRTLEALRLIPLILQTSSRISASLGLSSNSTDTDALLMKEAAHTIVRISQVVGSDGLGNFRFCMAFRCRPGIPFFPAAYCDGKEGGPPAVVLGLENSDLFVQAFQGCTSLPEASVRLQAVLKDSLVPLDAMAQRAVTDAGGVYNGIDASANPSLAIEHSLVRAYESLLGEGGFGTVGSLAVSEVITRSIRETPIKHTGYSGLMLPVLEDRLLAQRAAQEPPAYRISDLLSYSSVCGVGLDTIPIGGQESPDKIARVLADTAALACKYDKPLSVRLFPTPGKSPGELTSFVSPYLCNTKVFAIS